MLVEDRTPRSEPGPRDPDAATTGPEALGDLLAAVLRSEGIPAGAEAGLHLVGVAEMSGLNADAMGVDGPTDVLSFPIDGTSCRGLAVPAHAGPSGSSHELSGRQPETVLVGDLVLCPEVAAANAADHAGTFADELRLLVVHGGLHLCGWDHRTSDEQRSMWRRERDLMASLQVSPSGDPWGEP